MVDAVVGILLDKLLAFFVHEGQQLLGFNTQLDKLKDELRFLQSYIKEADGIRTKEGRDILKLVTSDLRELVYDAEDVIADCNIEFLKQHDGHLLNIVSRCSPRLLKSRLKISKSLKKLNQRIEVVKEKMGTYVPAAPGTIISREKESTTLSSYPILFEDDVGLEDDASKIENWILESQEPSTIIGIVGMGGIGKTTLARKICKKDRIKNSFKHKISVTVSQNCEFEELLKRMLIKMNVAEKSLKNKDVEYLLEKLKEKLGREKYLVVLDDVWENKWSWWYSLGSALPRNLGYCVIVTTRNENVARRMGATEEHIHHPKTLSEDDSWSLFSKIAFARNGGKYPNSDVEGLGREIVASCKGLPLAIRVVGGMMRGKDDSFFQWKRISDQLKEESAKEKMGELVMSSLKLSYEELPTYLKPCFLCFSMLPEDYVMKVDDLVCWWVGEGFVSETNARTTLEIGREYAVELCNRSLLLGGCDIFDRIFEEIKIHDLVRDMAIKIARDVSFTYLDEKGTPELRPESRRLGIFDDEAIKSVKSTGAKNFKTESKLRTLWGMCMEKEVLLNKNLKLRKLKRLRVLTAQFHLKNQEQIIMKDWLYGITSLLNLVSLSLEDCTVEELPDSIGNLHNLQILTLSYFAVEKLPDSIGNLHNLQILALNFLEYLKMLPSTISKLDKLISFRVYQCGYLTCMPEGIGRLSKLERLVWFPYPRANSSQRIASSICQLKNLRQLKVLQVELKNQNYLEQLKLNVLSELKHLHYMEISFFDCRGGVSVSNYFEGGVSVSNLNHLPLQCLEELTLTFYPGESTPVWLNPTSLPNLKFLCIDHGYRLSHMSSQFWEGTWKIEALYFRDLQELEEEWMKFLGAMPSLRMVKVSYCPKLKSFPLDLTQYDAIWRK